MPETNAVPPDLNIKLPMSAKTADRMAWAAWALVILGTVAGALAAMALVPAGFYRQLAAAVGTLSLLVAQLIQRKLPSAAALANLRKVGIAGAAGLMAFVFLSGCPKASSVATKTAAGVMYATKATSKGLAVAPGVTCEQLKAYRDNIRPAVRTSVGVTYGGIRIDQVAGKDNVNYLAALMPGACMLIVGLREWGHKLPDRGRAVMGWLGVFSGAVCDKVKSSSPKLAIAATITALLPVAVELVKWIIGIVSASDDKLMKEINAWVQGPAADEVDAAIKARCPGGA